MTPGSRPLDGGELKTRDSDPEAVLEFMEQIQSEPGLNKLDLHWQIELKLEGRRSIFVVEIPASLDGAQKLDWLREWLDDFGDREIEWMEAYCDDAYFDT